MTSPNLLKQKLAFTKLTLFSIPQPFLNLFKKFRLFPFRSPLLRESFLLSFPLGTKMFQFPRFALYLLINSVIRL